MRKTWSTFSEALPRLQTGWSTCLVGEGFGSFGLKKRWLAGAAPQHLWGAIDGAGLFTAVHGRKMGDNRHNLKEVTFRQGIRKSFSLGGQTGISPRWLGRLCRLFVEFFRTSITKALCFGTESSRGPCQTEFSSDLIILWRMCPVWMQKLHKHLIHVTAIYILFLFCCYHVFWWMFNGFACSLQ